MSFKEIKERIENSQAFKDFKVKFPDALFCAAFIILDFISNDDKKTLDYMVDERIFTFTVERNGDITMMEDRILQDNNRPSLEELEPSVGVEIEDLRGVAGMKALDEGVHEKFHKIIAVLQRLDGKQVWNLTCMLENMVILTVIIDMQGNILKFERRSMMDMIRKK